MMPVGVASHALLRRRRLSSDTLLLSSSEFYVIIRSYFFACFMAVKLRRSLLETP